MPAHKYNECRRIGCIIYYADEDEEMSEKTHQLRALNGVLQVIRDVLMVI